MATNRVYIGGLPSGVTLKDLELFFKPLGTVREVLLKQGFGFANFSDADDAKKAIIALDGKMLLDKRVTLEFARDAKWYAELKAEPPRCTEFQIIVQNLSSAVTWQDLKDHMRKAGEIVYVAAHDQRMNEGVVEFSCYNDMKAALDMFCDTELNGRRLKLIYDAKPYTGLRSPVKSKSRSKTRSRKGDSQSPCSSRSTSKSRSTKDSKRSRSVSRDSRHKSKSHSPSKKKHSNSESRSRSRSKTRDTSRSRKEGRDRKYRSRSRSHDKYERQFTGEIGYPKE